MQLLTLFTRKVVVVVFNIYFKEKKNGNLYYFLIKKCFSC